MKPPRLTAPDLDALTSARAGERKLGEVTWRAPEGAEWEASIGLARSAGVRFVLMGVPEDVGVRANLGVTGARDGWACALPGIANVQSNRFLSGSDVWIAGALDIADLCDRAESVRRDAMEADALRAMVAELDSTLEAALLPLFAAGLHPIVIGGGNNNSLPIIRALAQCERATRPDSRIHVLNCDPHADFRAPEGRHSGNPFRYAIEEGTLDRYFALLLHKSYNSESIIAAMQAASEKQPRVAWNWLEDVLEGILDIDDALEQAIAFVEGGTAIGLELDCDAIAGFPTSAYTPSGLHVEQARRLMLLAARRLKPRYLHLSEAAPSRTADGESFARKTLAYLVTDHLRAMGAAGMSSSSR